MKYKKTINNITVILSPRTASPMLVEEDFVSIGDRFGEGIQGLKIDEVKDLIYMLQEIVELVEKENEKR